MTAGARKTRRPRNPDGTRYSRDAGGHGRARRPTEVPRGPKLGGAAAARATMREKQNKEAQQK